MHEMGYHKRAPRRKFNVTPQTRPGALRGVRNGCTGRRRGGRESSGQTNPPSRHLALDTGPGLSVQLTRSTTLTASTGSSSPAGNLRWLGGPSVAQQVETHLHSWPRESQLGNVHGASHGTYLPPFVASAAKSMDGPPFKKTTLQATKEQPKSSDT